MRIHAIQTGTIAVKQRQRSGKGDGALRLVNTLLDHRWTEPLPILAWVIEHPEGLIVVDTGETARATEPGYFTAHPYYRLGVREWITPEQEIGPQLRSLGIAPADVRWVVMTHLHTDHHGGLAHFPGVEILVARAEYRAAAGFAGKLRGFLPHRWPDWFRPRLVDYRPEPFGPFPSSFPLTKAGDVTIVPTPGHSPGHQAVVLRDRGISYFFAGDTSYTERAMLDRQLDAVSVDLSAARASLDRTLKYVRTNPTVYLPSHDPESVRRLAGTVVTQPG